MNYYRSGCLNKELHVFKDRNFALSYTQKSYALQDFFSKIKKKIDKLELKLSSLDQLISKYLQLLNEILMDSSILKERDASNLACIDGMENENTFSLNKVRYDESEKFDSFKYFSSNSGLTLLITNLYDLKTEGIPLSHMIPVTNLGAYLIGKKSHSLCNICKLPDNKLFCFPSAYHQLIGVTFILDYSYQVEIIRSGPATYGTCSAYFDDNVYLLGGSGKDNIKNICAKYNLLKSKGTQLSSMDRIDTFNNCVVFTNKILYSPNQADICIYDPFSDSHSYVLVLDGDKYENEEGVIFVSSERAYLLSTLRSEIYESNVNDPYNWKVFMNDSGLMREGWTLSDYVIKDDDVNLLFEDTLYKLNLKTKVTSIVTINNKNW